MEPLWQELRYAARRLLRLAIFTLIIVIALALGAGATTTVSIADSKEDQGLPQAEQAGQPERRSFWERVFKLPPLRKRIEKALTEDWKLSEVRPRHIVSLLGEDAEEIRRFFLSGANARQYQRLLREVSAGNEAGCRVSMGGKMTTHQSEVEMT